MLDATDTKHSPWHIVRSDDKRRARLNCISHLLSQIPYEPVPRDEVRLPKRSKKRAYDDAAHGGPALDLGKILSPHAGRTTDVKRYLPIALAVAIIGFAGLAMAAEMDMSKLTCKEIGRMPASQDDRHCHVDERLCSWQSWERHVGRRHGRGQCTEDRCLLQKAPRRYLG